MEKRRVILGSIFALLAFSGVYYYSYKRGYFSSFDFSDPKQIFRWIFIIGFTVGILTSILSVFWSPFRYIASFFLFASVVSQFYFMKDAMTYLEKFGNKDISLYVVYADYVLIILSQLTAIASLCRWLKGSILQMVEGIVGVLLIGYLCYAIFTTGSNSFIIKLKYNYSMISYMLCTLGFVEIGFASPKFYKLKSTKENEEKVSNLTTVDAQ